MITQVSKDTTPYLYEAYKRCQSENQLILSEETKKELDTAFIISDAYLTHDFQWQSVALIFPYNNTLAINPWFLNGIPFGEPEARIDEAIKLFKLSKYHTLELISTKKINCQLPFQYDYADMLAYLRPMPVIDHPYTFKGIEACNLSELKLVFQESFSEGDAKFFAFLDTEYQIKFWQYLRYEDAIKNPCSLGMFDGETLIGFSLVLDDGEKNQHVSCMCLKPSYQGKGLGKIMLSEMFNRALSGGNQTMTLGTETQMRAHALYLKYGFKDIEVRHHYILRKEP